MGFSDIFDVIDTMVDIVKGGIDSYKSGEKLDELIEKSITEYADVLSDDEKAMHKKYINAKTAYEEQAVEFDNDKKNELLQQSEKCQVEYLEAIEQNDALPKDFRDEIKNSVAEFKEANNMALENLEKKFTKRAENEEQKQLIKKTFEYSKMK